MNPYRKHLPLLILSLLILLAHLPQTDAQGGNQVALVVDYGDGNVQTSCLNFSEESLTGYEVLQRSNLPLTVGVGGAGTSICAIGGVGCPASDCFCQCTGGADCIFWSYWHGQADSWEFSGLGANNYTVYDGAVEGWRWGQGSTQNADPPPFYAFGDICTAPDTPTPIPIVVQATATATTSSSQPNPTATMTQTAVPTTPPTATATVLPTNSPTPLPTATATSETESNAVTPSPTVDLSSPGTARPTVTPWPTAAASEADATATLDPASDTNAAAATPTSEIIVVALPTVDNEVAAVSIAAETAVLPPTPINQPVAIAANVQPIAEPAVANPATARIGALVEPANAQMSSPTTPETAVPLANYAIFGLILLALSFVWWQGKREA
ncbi:MAG: hypothetical protein AAF614_40750 [Chloroflexota bacterium]